MSNEEKPQVNSLLTERINNAYLASGYGLFRGEESIVLISGKKDGAEPIEIKLTLEALESAVTNMRYNIASENK